MDQPGDKPVTRLLREWRGGREAALEELMPVVYDELRRLAKGYLRGERQDHTLQGTALVNEAYMRLVDMDVSWQDRAHFFAVAARLMRRMLVDHARARGRGKRGGGESAMTLDEPLVASPERAPDLLALDDALSSLTQLDPRKSQIVELHFFGGMTYEETAEALGVSPATVHRELRLAKAWLHHELGASPESS
jgi:RNA polymerase sigma-70 factor (ECF subfamily)